MKHGVYTDSILRRSRHPPLFSIGTQANCEPLKIYPCRSEIRSVKIGGRNFASGSRQGAKLCQRGATPTAISPSVASEKSPLPEEGTTFLTVPFTFAPFDLLSEAEQSYQIPCSNREPLCANATKSASSPLTCHAA